MPLNTRHAKEVADDGYITIRIAMFSTGDVNHFQVVTIPYCGCFPLCSRLSAFHAQVQPPFL
jgi:hypothetical protein